MKSSLSGDTPTLSGLSLSSLLWSLRYTTKEEMRPKALTGLYVYTVCIYTCVQACVYVRMSQRDVSY